MNNDEILYKINLISDSIFFIDIHFNNSNINIFDIKLLYEHEKYFINIHYNLYDKNIDKYNIYDIINIPINVLDNNIKFKNIYYNIYNDDYFNGNIIIFITADKFKKDEYKLLNELKLILQ